MSTHFEDAARAEAERKYLYGRHHETTYTDYAARREQMAFAAGAAWGRRYEAEREATDQQVLAALNAYYPWATEESLDGWPEGNVLCMRAALTAARKAGMEE